MGKRAWNKSRGRESNRRVKYMFAVTPTDWKHEPSPHGRVGLALTGKVSLAMVLLWSKNARLQAAICCFSGDDPGCWSSLFERTIADDGSCEGRHSGMTPNTTEAVVFLLIELNMPSNCLRLVRRKFRTRCAMQRRARTGVHNHPATGDGARWLAVEGKNAYQESLSAV